MHLPNRETAYVPPQKLTDYLLSETHPVGKGKAKFFRKHGFNETNINLLEFGLLEIARLQEVVETEVKPRGTMYAIEGDLTTPHNRQVRVRTVWIIETDRTSPRFVTAYPA